MKNLSMISLSRDELFINSNKAVYCMQDRRGMHSLFHNQDNNVSTLSGGNRNHMIPKDRVMKHKEKDSQDIEFLKIQYLEKNPGWKNVSDRRFGKKEIAQVISLLNEKKLLPTNTDDALNFSFVDVSANKPTHPLSFLEELKRIMPHKKIRVIAGDMLANDLMKTFSKTMQQRTKVTDNFSYICWDGRSLPVKPNSADVIFDRKGCLWHSKTRKEIIDSINHFYSILKKNGFILTDSIEAPFLQIEMSTISRIKGIFKESNLSGTRRRFPLFDIFDIGDPGNKMTVFKKKG